MPDIKVTEITAKATKTGKPYWLVADGNGAKHSVWEPTVHAFLEEHLGQPVAVVIRQDGKYTTIESAALPPPPVEKPQGNGWKRDPAESSLIVRQSCLKAAVDWLRGGPGIEYGKDPEGYLLLVADRLVAWVRGGPEPQASPEQRAAQEALATGGSYSAALANQKPHVTASLKPDQSLGAAVAEVLANHDPMADDERPPHPADAYGRETLRPSGAPRR